MTMSKIVEIVDLKQISISTRLFEQTIAIVSGASWATVASIKEHVNK